MLVKIPELQRPILEERQIGDERPIFILDQWPQFGSDAGRADRAVIPPDSGLLLV